MVRRGVRLFGLLVAVAAAAWGGRAEAAGFAIREQSVAAMGGAFAGASAAAEDPSYLFFNPAALAYQEGIQTVAALNYLRPEARLRRARASTLLGTPIPGRARKGDVAEDALVPALYGSWQVDSRWWLGLAITAPFGLETSYPDGWVGRYYALNSRLRTVNLQPTVAVRPAAGLAIGFGLQLQYVDARLTNAIDFGTIGLVAGIPGSTPSAQDGRVDLQGDGFGLGWVLGAIFEPWDGGRIGIGFRSSIRQRIEGRADFTLDGAGIGAALSALTGRFRDSDARVGLELPETVSFGFVQELTDRLQVMGEAAFTRWSRFRELRVEFANPAEPDSVVAHNWQNSWFFALGLRYRLGEDWILRAGVAHDQTPIQNAFRTPRIPGNDRWWVSLGLSWRPRPGVEVDLGYVHLFVEDAELRLTTAGVGNRFRGNLSASYANRVDLFSLSARVRF